LEPVEFVAAYIATSGEYIAAIVTFAVGELLKLVSIERLFDLTREKLMRISAFASVYGHYLRARNLVLQSEAWQSVRSASRRVMAHIRSAFALSEETGTPLPLRSR
jgi:hypothetical protein